jgi:hypothetical protein
MSSEHPTIPDAPALAMSVEQFCKTHNISVGFFYVLQRRGLAPRVMRVGLRVLISAEEAAAWRAARTTASNPSAAAPSAA